MLTPKRIIAGVVLIVALFVIITAIGSSGKRSDAFWSRECTSSQRHYKIKAFIQGLCDTVRWINWS
ncbi:MAG: hypothetical protein NT077_04740 [Candidatus Taylorbacteria bacterium]|nr:hypothetical protein [Candidatus Taylorbacteria bacterium]